MLSNTIQSIKRALTTNRAFWLILSIFGDLLWLATTILPKDKSVWIFGAWFGDSYSDNSKYLFEYANRCQPNIRAVWLTKNAAAYNLVKKRGYEVHFVNSFRGFLLRVVSSVWVTSAGIFDFNSFHTWPIGRVKIVELLHGTPLKSYGYDDPEHVDFSKGSNLARLHALPLNKLVGLHDLYIAASDEVRDKWSTAFRIPLEMIKVTGYPRTDALFSPERPKVPITDLLRELKRNSTLAIYLPTHRQGGETSISFLLNDLNAINSRLAKLHAVLLVKVHRFHLKDLAVSDGNLSNVIFVNDDDIDQDIYTILPEVDLLITDYSSVYFDYLLLNKPIIFAPFDIDEYTADRPLYYNYDEVTPGPKARNWDEVVSHVAQIIRDGDEWGEQRQKVNSIFNAYHDGNSSQRVYQVIIADLGLLDANQNK